MFLIYAPIFLLRGKPKIMNLDPLSHIAQINKVAENWKNDYRGYYDFACSV